MMSFASATSAWDGGLSNSSICNLRAPRLARSADNLLDWSHLEPWRRRGLLLFLLDGLAVIFVMSFALTYVPLYAWRWAHGRGDRAAQRRRRAWA